MEGRFMDVFADDVYGCASVFDAADLETGGTDRNKDVGGVFEATGCGGDGETVISGRRGNDGRLGGKVQHGVCRASNLEGPSSLPALQLCPDLAVGGVEPRQA